MAAFSAAAAAKTMLQIKAAASRLAMLRPPLRIPTLPMFAWLILPLLALAVLGAHFMRAGAWPLVLACAALALLMAWPRRWAARTVQVALVLGAAEWLWTLALLAQQRIALGQPWLRMALILGAVALFTAGAALVFQRRASRLRYGIDRDSATG